MPVAIHPRLGHERLYLSATTPPSGAHGDVPYSIDVPPNIANLSQGRLSRYCFHDGGVTAIASLRQYRIDQLFEVDGEK
ncbi:MAG: hypothetical protein HY730_02095 [Candidatus Tectomicrobia bacterium]|uniref:Uncharacterized protein n=1 Tax=Tectimicrobiota bacterium TaxID=2528274 RepID=A0A933GLW2_UNCTE|nr:hypothetical protein [Candidatus Tectomicrobia bacterium]